MSTYKRKRLVIGILILGWMVFFSFQGLGILGSSINPRILGMPFSVFYLVCMGIWGVLNAYLTVKLLSPEFYEKAFKVLEQVEKN